MLKNQNEIEWNRFVTELKKIECFNDDKITFCKNYNQRRKRLKLKAIEYVVDKKNM